LLGLRLGCRSRLQLCSYLVTCWPHVHSISIWLFDANTVLVLIPFFAWLNLFLQTRSQRYLRRILAFISLDKALEFHEIVAWFILLAGVMHKLMHLVKYYPITLDSSMKSGHGLQELPSSYACCSCTEQFHINTKWAHFELFWYTHHFFTGFFIFLVPHGRGGFNRNVWKSLVILTPIYLLQRLYRTYSAYRTVAFATVINMGNVVAIGFDRKSAFPNGYKKGQYVYLNVPHVSRGEWHPFTISSAPAKDLSVQKDRVWMCIVERGCHCAYPSFGRW